MKKIEVFECDYCKKLYRSKGGISNHEKVCFQNPDTKSCITCEFLSSCGAINGKKITDQEDKITRYEVPETLDLVRGDMECDHYRFKEEYEYLNEVVSETFCESLKIILPRLRTNCNSHKVKSLQNVKGLQN